MNLAKQSFDGGYSNVASQVGPGPKLLKSAEIDQASKKEPKWRILLKWKHVLIGFL